MKPKLSDLTLRERIGQTAVVRPKFVKGDDYFKRNPYGALWNTVLFDKANMDNLAGIAHKDTEDLSYSADFAKSVKKISDTMTVPLLVATDAERGAAYPGATAITTATGLGATDSEELIGKVGSCVAAEMKACGINWIWGPVIDNPNPFCAVSVTRNYSDNPELIGKYGAAQMKGIQSQKVAATAKHFPGADKDEYRDGHIAPNAINQSFDEWYERQGRVFQDAIDAGVYSIMVGHVSFEAVDNTEVQGGYMPATLSYKIVTELLKEKMGFKGVVVTDAIGMKGLTAICHERKELYVRLLEAGNDVILGPTGDDYIDAVEEAILSGRLSEDRVNDACQRVLDMKEKLGFFDDDFEFGKGITHDILDNTSTVNKEVAKKSISLICNENNLIPLNKEKIKNVKLIYIGYDESSYERLSYVSEAFKKRGASVDIQKNIGEEIEEIAKEYDLILYFGDIKPHMPMGGACFFGDEFVSFVYVMTYGKEKSIGISLSSPYIFYDYFPNAPTFINAYGNSLETLDAIVAGIYGEYEFEGKCPVSLIPQR